MENKRLRIVAKGFENYTGNLGVYPFVDGESVEAIPRQQRDRIAATIRCVEIGENGQENFAGISERLVADSATRAPVKTPLKRQSVESKVEEEVSIARGDEEPRAIYTEDQLDEIIESGGIAALRKIADIWNVKNRSIPTLRQMILDEQDAWASKDGIQQKRKEDMIKKIAEDTLKANKVDPQVDEKGEDQVENSAISGDMSAAISISPDKGEEG